ncbi:MAG TPA: cutinase family protein [Pseudonocardiaceae bacterium]|jgi:hypothetical protein
MPRLRRTIALAAATCALLATATVAQAAPVAAQPDNCADIVFVGARGSGESPGLGATVQDTADRYQNKVGPLATIETRPVMYPAVPILGADVVKNLKDAFMGAGPWRWRPGPEHRWPPLPGLGPAGSTSWLLGSRARYDDSVAEGASNIRAQVSSFAVRCSNTRYVLAGYSQGAQAVTRFLESIDPASQADRAIAERIVGIALFGSPVFAQYDPPERVNRSLRGPAPYSFLEQGVYWTLDDTPIGEPSVLSRQPWVAKSHSYCLEKDVVCQSSTRLYRLFQFLGIDEGPSSIEPHLRYRAYYTADAAGWLAGLTGQALRSGDPRAAFPR